MSGGGRRRKKHEEHENHERWLVSYADLLTLLFAFFVVMYAVSRVDTQRVIQAADSLRWALNFEGTGGVTQLALFNGPPSEGGCAMQLNSGANGMQEKQRMENVRRELQRKLSNLITAQSGVLMFVSEEGTLTVRLSAQRFFDPGQAALRPDALPLIDAVAAELHLLGYSVRVEAHTDEIHPRGTRFRDNWELSASRAATVTSFLEQAHEFPPWRLTAAGMGAARPIASNDTPEGRELNRRVDLVVEFPPATGAPLIQPAAVR